MKLLGDHISRLKIGTVLVRLCIKSVKVGTDIIKIVTEFFFESRGRIKTKNGYLIGQNVLIIGAKKRINQSRDGIRKNRIGIGEKRSHFSPRSEPISLLEAVDEFEIC